MGFNCSNITCVNGHGRMWVNVCLYLELSNIFHCKKLFAAVYSCRQASSGRKAGASARWVFSK